MTVEYEYVVNIDFVERTFEKDACKRQVRHAIRPLRIVARLRL